MTTTCQLCQTPGLEWSENTNKHGKHWLYNPNTGQEHHCEIPKIPLFDIVNGIAYPRNDLYVAKDITSRAVEFKLDPYRVRVQRQGDYLVVKA